MKNLILAMLLLLMISSCTKPEPIKSFTERPTECGTDKYLGNYYQIGYSGMNWGLSDTLQFSSYKDSVRIIFPQQTASNKFEIYFYSSDDCKQTQFQFINPELKTIISHNMFIYNDTLRVCTVDNTTDTIGIKFYKKY